MSIEAFAEILNNWGSHRIPFLFLVDFEMKRPLALRLSEIDPAEITYDFNGISNDNLRPYKKEAIDFQIQPISLEEFEKKFSLVMRHLEYGDSYLTNLTIRTLLNTSLDLNQLFYFSKAKYRLRYRNDFLFFSPETFVQIKDGKIFAFPMKGTIDAAIPFAREQVLSDSKEMAEHVTIVDLIRNDLSRVAEKVNVKRFRYIDELKTNDKTLLQVSSEIAGELRSDYLRNLGTILVNLLPAGSVSGAPKSKTIEIIRAAEGEERGFYTGVAGIFDGQHVDSGVMIRFMEQQNGRLFYRSGGGITTQSVMEKEYQEAIDKVYVPLN